MDLDATQALDESFQSEEDDNKRDPQKTQVGTLKVKSSRYLDSADFPIYEGQNIVGRHDKADVYIPIKPLSKKHACIEVISGQHFVFDYGSKNKTRRGKMILRPNVRYELSDGSELSFADVKCIYSYIQGTQEDDDTDSLSDAGSESMLIPEENVAEPESILSSQGKEESSPQENVTLQPVRDNSDENFQNPVDAVDNILTNKKNESMNSADEEIYAAETDCESDSSDTKPFTAETPSDLKRITTVKQTPGTLLKRLHGIYLNHAGDSTKAINDSMQSIEASDLSLKLDGTQGSEQSSPQISTESRFALQNKSSLILEKSRLLVGEAENGKANNQGYQKPDLSIQKSDSSDNKDQITTNSKVGSDSSCLSLKTTPKLLIQESDEEDSQITTTSTDKSDFTGKSSVQIQNQANGLLIQESDDDNTDASVNEETPFEMGKTGFFTPQLLKKQLDGRIKESDLMDEADNNVESIYSPAVACSSSDRSVVTKSIENEGTKDESAPVSDEYMLMPTQAYGVEDSSDDDTDIEDTEGFKCTESGKKITAESKQKECSEKHMIMSNKEAIMQDFTNEQTTGIQAGRQVQVRPAEASTSSELNTVHVNYSEQEAATGPMYDSEQEADTLPPADSYPHASSDLLRESTAEQLLASAANGNFDKEVVTASVHNSEQDGTISFKHCSGQEAATASLQNSGQEASTASLDSSEQVAAIAPIEEFVQDVVTTSLHDSGKEAAATSLRSCGQEAATDSLDNSGQEAATAAIEEFDEEDDTVSIHSFQRETATASLHVPEQEATAQEYLIKQEVTTALLGNESVKQERKEHKEKLKGAALDEIVVTLRNAACAKDNKSSSKDPEKPVSTAEEFDFDQLSANVMTQAYNILPERPKPSGSTCSNIALTLPGASNLVAQNDVTESLLDHQQLKCETSVSGETQAYGAIDDVATQAYGVEAATIPYNFSGNEMDEVVPETQSYEDTDGPTQAYGLQDSTATLLYSSSKHKCNKQPRTAESEEDENSTQAYGLSNEVRLSCRKNEKRTNSQDGDDQCATQAYGIMDQPTLLYDANLDEDLPNNEKTYEDECESQSYGIVGHSARSDEYESDKIVNQSADEDTADQCATQAYGLSEQQTLAYDMYPDEESLENERAFGDECETQAYGDDECTTEKMICKSDDEDLDADEFATQAYGILDQPAGLYKGNSDGEMEMATQAYGSTDGDSSTVTKENNRYESSLSKGKNTRGKKSTTLKNASARGGSFEECSDAEERMLPEGQGGQFIGKKRKSGRASQLKNGTATCLEVSLVSDVGLSEEKQENGPCSKKSRRSMLRSEDILETEEAFKNDIKEKRRSRASVSKKTVKISDEEDSEMIEHSEAGGEERNWSKNEGNFEDAVIQNQSGMTVSNAGTIKGINESVELTHDSNTLFKKGTAVGKRGSQERGKKSVSFKKIDAQRDDEHVRLELSDKRLDKGSTRRMSRKTDIVGNDNNLEEKTNKLDKMGINLTRSTVANRRRRQSSKDNNALSAIGGERISQIELHSTRQSVDRVGINIPSKEDDGDGTTKKGTRQSTAGKRGKKHQTKEDTEESASREAKDASEVVLHSKRQSVGKHGKQLPYKEDTGENVTRQEAEEKCQTELLSTRQSVRKRSKMYVTKEDTWENETREYSGEAGETELLSTRKSVGKRGKKHVPKEDAEESETREDSGKAGQTELLSTRKSGGKRGKKCFTKEYAEESETREYSGEAGQTELLPTRISVGKRGKKNVTKEDAEESETREDSGETGQTYLLSTRKPVGKRGKKRVTKEGAEESETREDSGEIGQTDLLSTRKSVDKRGRKRISTEDAEESETREDAGEAGQTELLSRRKSMGKRGKKCATKEDAEEIKIKEETGKTCQTVLLSTQQSFGKRGKKRVTKEGAEENETREDCGDAGQTELLSTLKSVVKRGKKCRRSNTSIESEELGVRELNAPDDASAVASSSMKIPCEKFENALVYSLNRENLGNDIGLDQSSEIDFSDNGTSSSASNSWNQGPTKKNQRRKTNEKSRSKDTISVLHGKEAGCEVDARPKIMFTGLTDKDMEQSVARLGADLADSVYDTTHLVTDKVRRTVKFLCCLSRGIHIVSPDWLDNCRKIKKFTGDLCEFFTPDADDFTIKDSNSEEQYNFNLRGSIEEARRHKLLNGYSVFVTKSVKPNKKQMEDIIQCCEGKALHRLPKNMDDKTLIISCEEDKTEIKNAVNSGYQVYTPEVLLTGILRQKLELEEFKLDVDFGSAKRGGKRRQSKSELETSKATPKRRKR